MYFAATGRVAKSSDRLCPTLRVQIRATLAPSLHFLSCLTLFNFLLGGIELFAGIRVGILVSLVLLLGSPVHCTMCTLDSFFSFRPSVVGHIVQPRDCHIIAKVCFAQCSTSRLALGSPGWLVGCHHAQNSIYANIYRI